MEPTNHKDGAHIVSLQEHLRARLDSPAARVAFASTLVLIGIYLYLVPNSIKVSERNRS